MLLMVLTAFTGLIVVVCAIVYAWAKKRQRSPKPTPIDQRLLVEDLENKASLFSSLNREEDLQRFTRYEEASFLTVHCSEHNQISEPVHQNSKYREESSQRSPTPSKVESNNTTSSSSTLQPNTSSEALVTAEAEVTKVNAFENFSSLAYVVTSRYQS